MIVCYMFLVIQSLHTAFRTQNYWPVVLERCIHSWRECSLRPRVHYQVLLESDDQMFRTLLGQMLHRSATQNNIIRPCGGWEQLWAVPLEEALYKCVNSVCVQRMNTYKLIIIIIIIIITNEWINSEYSCSWRSLLLCVMSFVVMQNVVCNCEL